MADPGPDETNPFRAPTARIGAATITGATADAELVRRAYLGREASVRSLGMILYLFAGFAALAVVGYGIGAVVLSINPPPNLDAGPIDLRVAMLLGAGASLGVAALQGAWGWGLRRLHTWARWLTVVLTALTLAFCGLVVLVVLAMSFFGGSVPMAIAIAAIYAAPMTIAGAILGLMIGPKGSMVFSPEYQDVIRQTPHIKYKTSRFVKVLMWIVLIIVVGVGLLAGIAALRNAP